MFLDAKQYKDTFLESFYVKKKTLLSKHLVSGRSYVWSHIMRSKKGDLMADIIQAS